MIWLDEPQLQAHSKLMHLITVEINLNKDREACESQLISALSYSKK